MTNPAPWIDDRLAARSNAHAICYNRRRHQYPWDAATGLPVYNESAHEYNTRGLLIVKRWQRCDICGTVCSILVNVQTWQVVSTPHYDWPEGYRVQGERPTPEAMLRDLFMRTSPLVAQLTAERAPARKAAPTSRKAPPAKRAPSAPPARKAAPAKARRSPVFSGAQ